MANTSEMSVSKATRSPDLTAIVDGIENIIKKTFEDISTIASKASTGEMDEIEALLAIETLSKKITKLVCVLGEV